MVVNVSIPIEKTPEAALDIILPNQELTFFPSFVEDVGYGSSFSAL